MFVNVFVYLISRSWWKNAFYQGFRPSKCIKHRDLQCFIIIFNENSLPHGVPPSKYMGFQHQTSMKVKARNLMNFTLHKWMSCKAQKIKFNFWEPSPHENNIGNPKKTREPENPHIYKVQGPEHPRTVWTLHPTNLWRFSPKHLWNLKTKHENRQPPILNLNSQTSMKSKVQKMMKFISLTNLWTARPKSHWNLSPKIFEPEVNSQKIYERKLAKWDLDTPNSGIFRFDDTQGGGGWIFHVFSRYVHVQMGFLKVHSRFFQVFSRFFTA